MTTRHPDRPVPVTGMDNGGDFAAKNNAFRSSMSQIEKPGRRQIFLRRATHSGGRSRHPGGPSAA